MAWFESVDIKSDDREWCAKICCRISKFRNIEYRDQQFKKLIGIKDSEQRRRAFETVQRAFDKLEGFLFSLYNHYHLVDIWELFVADYAKGNLPEDLNAYIIELKNIKDRINAMNIRDIQKEAIKDIAKSEMLTTSESEGGCFPILKIWEYIAEIPDENIAFRTKVSELVSQKDNGKKANVKEACVELLKIYDSVLRNKRFAKTEEGR